MPLRFTCTQAYVYRCNEVTVVYNYIVSRDLHAVGQHTLLCRVHGLWEIGKKCYRLRVFDLQSTQKYFVLCS